MKLIHGKECVSCGELTKYVCIDCATDKAEFVYVCNNEDCKNKHELKDCSRTHANK